MIQLKATPNPLPSFSKRVLAAIIVVLPIVLAIDVFVGPMMVNLPSIVSALIYVFIISPLVTLFMPIIVKRINVE